MFDEQSVVSQLEGQKTQCKREWRLDWESSTVYFTARGFRVLSLKNMRPGWDRSPAPLHFGCVILSKGFHLSASFCLFRCCCEYSIR